MPAINYVGSTIDSQSHCAIRQVAQMSEMLGTKTSFCDLIIRYAMLSRFATLFQFQVPTSTALCFYLESVAKRKLALET